MFTKIPRLKIKTISLFSPPTSTLSQLMLWRHWLRLVLLGWRWCNFIDALRNIHLLLDLPRGYGSQRRLGQKMIIFVGNQSFQRFTFKTAMGSDRLSRNKISLSHWPSTLVLSLNADTLTLLVGPFSFSLKMGPQLEHWEPINPLLTNWSRFRTLVLEYPNLNSWISELQQLLGLECQDNCES